VTAAFEAVTAHNESAGTMLDLLTREEDEITARYQELVAVLDTTSAALDERAEVIRLHIEEHGGAAETAGAETAAGAGGATGDASARPGESQEQGTTGAGIERSGSATQISRAGGVVADNSAETAAYVAETKAWIEGAKEAMAELDAAAEDVRADIDAANEQRTNDARALDALLAAHPRETFPTGLEGRVADGLARLDEARSLHTLAADAYSGLLAQIDALTEAIEEQAASGGDAADALQTQTELITELFALKQQRVQAAAGMHEAVVEEVDATSPLLATYRAKAEGGDGAWVDPDRDAGDESDSDDGQGGEGGASDNALAFVDWITATGAVIIEQNNEIQRKESRLKSLRALLLEEQGKLVTVRARMDKAEISAPEGTVETLQERERAERRAAGLHDTHVAARAAALDTVVAHLAHASAFEHVRAVMAWNATRPGGVGAGDETEAAAMPKHDTPGFPRREGVYATTGVSALSTYADTLSKLHAANVTMLESIHTWSDRLDEYTAAHTAAHAECIALLNPGRSGDDEKRYAQLVFFLIFFNFFQIYFLKI
jgi:hypothetical protein